MAASWIPRASTAAGITAVAALGLAVAAGASVSSGPLVVAGYGTGFQPLPRGEQGAVTRDADISITAAVPVRDMRIAFRARGLDIARTVTITFDGEPVRTVRLPADSNVPVVIVRRTPTAAGGHVVRLSASGPERPARPFIIVGDLSAQATEDSP
jgi:hypothetical protein